MLKIELDLACLNCCALTALSLVALLFICVDVHYFARVIGTAIYGLYIGKSIKFLKDSCTVYGICVLNDLDFVLKHMNNSRFVREMDFARVMFYTRTGALKVIKSLGGDIVQSATSIRHRRPVMLFSTYKITTKLIYWEDNAFYLEHEFITLKDGFVCAVVLSQQKLIKLTAKEVLQTILKDEVPEPPSPSEDLVYWMKSMKCSSEKLRKQD